MASGKLRLRGEHHPKDVIDEAMKLRQKGLTYSAIGRLLNVHPGTARYWGDKILGPDARRARKLTTNVPVIRFIHAEMVRQKLTVEKIAAKSGVGAATLVNWFAGYRRTPSYGLVEAVLNTLGYELKWTEMMKPDVLRPASVEGLTPVAPAPVPLDGQHP